MTVDETPPDNWALIATAELWKHRQEMTAPTQLAILRHAQLIVHADMLGQVLNPNDSVVGCYTNDGRSTPTSTRLEGLLAIWPVLTESASQLSLRGEMVVSIQLAIHFLMRCQMEKGPFAGAMPKGLHLQVQGMTEVRIDYIQHALSALLRYKDLQQQMESI